MGTDKHLISFDLETTGVDTFNDRIVSFAFIEINLISMERKVYARLVNPGMPIPEGATKIHGITDEMVANEPKFESFAFEINAIISNAIMMGSNIQHFDLVMLHYELKRCGYNWKPDMKNTVDVLQAETLFYPRNLGAIYKRYTGKDLEGAHGAAADASAVIDIVKAMMKKHRLDTMSQMIDASTQHVGKKIDYEGKLYRNPSDIICFTFGKYKDCSVKESIAKDPSYLDWIAKTFAGTSFLDIVLEIKKEMETHK